MGQSVEVENKRLEEESSIKYKLEKKSEEESEIEISDEKTETVWGTAE